MTTISSASASNASYYASQKSLFSKLDTDQNGTVSSDEYVSGRPKGVSESQAKSLYSKIDSDGSDALTEDQLNEGMSSQRSRMPEEMLSSQAMSVLMLMTQQGGGSFGSFDSESTSDHYTEMDTDGDGSVSSAEFVAARPDDVSEEDATNLFKSIDTENTGSITEEQFADSMGPAGGPPPGGAPSGSTEESDESASETFDSLDTNQDGVVSSDEFLSAFPSGLSDFSQSDLKSDIDKLLEMFSANEEA